MNYRVLAIKMIPLIVSFLILSLFSIFFCNAEKNFDSFLFICRFVVICIVINFVFLYFYQKIFLSSINLIYITFVLFQMGWMFIFFVDKDYTNPYLDLFSWDVLFDSVCFSFVSTQLFCIGIFSYFIFARKPKNGTPKVFFSSKISKIDSMFIYKVGTTVFLLSAIVVVPLYTYVSYMSICNGFSQVYRGYLSSNGLFNLARAFFFPSFILLLCYADNRRLFFAKIIFLSVIVEALICGTRTEGLIWILVCAMYYSNNINVITLKRKFLIAVSGTVAVFLGVYIAHVRVGYNVEYNLLFFVKSMFEEMGFNFTTICFITTYVPNMLSYQFGQTYINSLLMMIPESIDAFGIVSSLRDTIPAFWLYNINHLLYGGALDFGVGFSFIAEIYMNFGYFGILISFLFGYFVCSLYFYENKNCCKWNRYVQLVILQSLLCFPRRTFCEFMKDFEYGILFMGIIVIITYHLIKIKRV